MTRPHRSFLRKEGMAAFRSRVGGSLMARGTTEGCMSIDVRRWHREGVLRPGQLFAHALTWGGGPTEGMGVLTRADAVVLVFRPRSRFITQRVPITWTPCTCGRRPWFRCDVCCHGRHCGRRVALLYSAVGNSRAATATTWTMRASTNWYANAASGRPGKSG
jgi:hypothetical protein